MTGGIAHLVEHLFCTQKVIGSSPIASTKNSCYNVPVLGFIGCVLVVFRLVIAGRTNVGKSTLFNRLVGAHKAIVCNTPNVTRDSLEHFCERLRCFIVDTAGVHNEGLSGMFLEQTVAAVCNASLILFIVDGKHGVSPEDYNSLKLVRKANSNNARTLLVINKSDCSITQANICEFKSLGLGDGIEISAEHGVGIRNLEDIISECNNSICDPPPRGSARVALIGQPNVGKSSLTNKLLGYARVGVSNTPGTTREAVETSFSIDEHIITLVDNAGTRRRYSRERSDLENKSLQSALHAVERADVAILLVDASTGSITSQDLRLANAVLSKSKPLIIAASKCDVTPDSALVLKKLRDISQEIFLGSTVIGISSKTGLNCKKLIKEAITLHKRSHKKISSHILNEWLKNDVEKGHSPGLSSSSNSTRLKYISQCCSSPQKFKLYINTVEDNLGGHYEKYITNKLRKHFGFAGVPIELRVITSKNPYVKNPA